MKYGRLLIGILAIVVALWVILGEQMSGASADAVVNAPVVTIRAPVAGNLQLSTRTLGSRVTEGEVVASIEDPNVDRVRLDDLLFETKLEEAAHAQIEALLSESVTIRNGLAERTEIFRLKRLEELRERHSHAEVRLEILEQAGALSAVGEQPLLDAVEADSERLPAEPRLESLVLDHARERVAVLRIALQVAEQNVFLGDGYNDAPNAEQRRVELDREIADLTSRVAEAEERIAAVSERGNRERLRVNGLIGGELHSPVTGIFWEVIEANGVNVQRGDPLLRLIDCKATIVTLSVSERTYNDLAVGQAAKFRLNGSTEVYDATIGRLAGSGAVTVYRNMAIAPSPRHLERFDVTLTIPAIVVAGADGCKIGQTGRAFFDTRPLDGLRRLFD